MFFGSNGSCVELPFAELSSVTFLSYSLEQINPGQY